MCGYCTEPIALLAAARAAAPLAETRPADMPVLALQESPLIAATLAHPPASPNGSAPFALVLLARLGEVLFKQGFDSPAYVALRHLPDIAALVERACRHGRSDNSAATAGLLDTRPFDWLFEPCTYLEAGAFAARLPPGEAAIRLIEQYARWWLDGQGMRWMHLDDRDELADATPADLSLLRRSSVPLALAIDMAARDSGGSEAVWALVAKCPLHVPLFEAFDLYLQRRAARAVLDRAGIERFADAFYQLRPELLQYLALTGRITAEERARLRARLVPLGDDCGDFSRWRWLIDGALEQDLPHLP